MGLEQSSRTAAAAAVDLDRFRLRRFVEELAASGELETRSGPTRLADIARALEANPKAVLFETVGRDSFALVGNALGSRKRFAQAFGVTPQKLLPEILARLRGKAEFVEVGREQAPVQEIVQTGAEVDLTKLPVHLQHGKDGGPYISAGMDFTRDPATGLILLAFLLSTSTHLTVTLLSSLTSFLAALASLIAFAIDIALYLELKHEVDKLVGVSWPAVTGPGEIYIIPFPSLPEPKM